MNELQHKKEVNDTFVYEDEKLRIVFYYKQNILSLIELTQISNMPNGRSFCFSILPDQFLKMIEVFNEINKNYNNK